MSLNRNYQQAYGVEMTNTLMEAGYSDLRGLAGYFLAREKPGHALQPAALVHEAYLRITRGAGVAWLDQKHFYATASRQMQRILIDYGRKRRAAKRGAGLTVDFHEARYVAALSDYGDLHVNDLLRRLRQKDEVAAHVAELKIFNGMTHVEVANEIGCSRSTVKRHWDFAKGWLIHQIT